MPPYKWDKRPTLRLARDRNALCHLVSVVDATRQVRMWPLWWHLSQAWHGPALLDKLPGRGVGRLTLSKIPEGGVHIDLPRKVVGAWQAADTMGILPSTARGVERVADGMLGRPLRGTGVSVQRLFAPSPNWTYPPASTAFRRGSASGCFRTRADSPAGQIVKLADLLAPLGPGLVVSDDAVADFAVRPRKAEWARFVAACNSLRADRAESA